MKNRIYAITTYAGEWLYYSICGWEPSRHHVSDLAYPIANSQTWDSFTDAVYDKNRAARALGVPCRVVKIDLVEAK